MAKSKMRIPKTYSGLAKSFNPSQKIKTTPENPKINPKSDLLLNFSNPTSKLAIKIKTGVSAEMSEVKPVSYTHLDVYKRQD